jgi:hypothetical protein
MRAHRLLLLFALTAPSAAAADSLRCARGVVSEGDARIDLLGKCGTPDLRERRLVQGWGVATTGRMGADGRIIAGRTTDVVVEEWTYDFGPSMFSYLVTLENGRIVRIDRLGYGQRQEPARDPVPPPRATCDHLAGVSEGAGKLDVLARCSDPAVVDAWDEAGGAVRVEVWTYDLGRNRLVRFVRFENGRVTEVTTGSHGYAD